MSNSVRAMNKNKSVGASADAETGSRPAGQAELHRLDASRFDPARVLMDELQTGIANLKDTLLDTSSGDTFWHRYWAGYLRAYESLLEKLRLAIAMEARQGGDHEDERHAKHDSAGPQDIAQTTPPSSNEGKLS